jgi:Phosphotransferase enzyme family
VLTLAPPTLRPYAFLTDGSPGRFMDDVALAISSDAQALKLLDNPQAEVVSDLKTRVKSSGKPAVKALYWSVRCPDPGTWGRMQARTLLADPDRMDWIDLPQDPALPALADLHTEPGHWQILRYVPLRRATLLHRSASGPPVIIKVKRPDRAKDAAGRLTAAQAVLGQFPGFAIPRLLDTRADGTFALSLCRGASLSAGFPDDVPGLMRRIGQMHASLHITVPVGLPPGSHSPATDILDLAAALHPALCRLLAPLTQLLRSRPRPSAPVLCHGDLGFDQILHENGAMSLVDFDLCHAGEAAADIARFLVALAGNPPPGLPAAVAEAAYLDGYAELRALPDRDRLHWFQTEAVAARLLVCLRKDQAQPQQITRLLSQIGGSGLA